MEFTLQRDFSSLSSQAEAWNDLLAEGITHVPFLRYEYLAAWWQTRGGGEWPEADLAILIGSRDGRLAGIAPLFFARSKDGAPALHLLGSVEISDYLDLIVRPTDLPDFLSGLLDFLCLSGPGDWCALDWQNLPEGSPTLAALKAEAERRGWSFIQEQTYHAPSIPLKRDFETYLAGIDKKQRHEIRRKMRRAAESGRNVRWYIVQDADSLDAQIEDFLALMEQDPEKAAFLTPAMRQQMHLSCRAAFEQGWLQLAFLEVDGKKAAGYLNFDYQNRIWVYNSGVSRDFMELSPGWVLLGYLLEWANQNARLEFDFMRGDEDYKYRFGGVDRAIYRVRVAR